MYPGLEEDLEGKKKKWRKDFCRWTKTGTQKKTKVYVRSLSFSVPGSPGGSRKKTKKTWRVRLLQMDKNWS